jgi:hypothetical protein
VDVEVDGVAGAIIGARQRLRRLHAHAITSQ